MKDAFYAVWTIVGIGICFVLGYVIPWIIATKCFTDIP